MRAGRILRKIVMDRIIAQVPALGGRVYDKATEGTAYPFASMGPSDWVDESVECIKARSVSLQIDVWGSRSNKGALEDLTDDVATALEGFADEDRLTMHPIRVVSVQVMDDPDGSTVHGVVRIEVDVESNG